MFPAFRAKTSAILVDDDVDFLNDICDFLPDSHHLIKNQNPNSALDFIQANLLQFKNFPSKTIDALWRSFKDFPFNDLISVAIIDYRMLPIDGIELCRAIQAPFIKKIMLTSHATEKLAIEAFNSKIIDAFLLKTDPDLTETLAKTMEECTKKFFCELSIWLKNYQNSYNPLLNKNCDEFLSKFIKEKHVEQYCCFHDFNTIWLKNRDKQEQYLTLYSEESLEELLATEQSRYATKEITDNILQKKAAPCFPYSNNPLVPNGAEWAYFMKPLIKIDSSLYGSLS